MPTTRMAAYEKSLADARNRAQTIGAETRDKLHAEAEKNRKALEEQLNAKLARGREDHRRHQVAGDDERPLYRDRRGCGHRHAADRHSGA